MSFVIRYFPHRAELESKNSTGKEKRDPDENWKKTLTEADMGLFNILRDWRSQRCKKEGVPPYILFTNMQLAMIVKKRPQSYEHSSFLINEVGKMLGGWLKQQADSEKVR